MRSKCSHKVIKANAEILFFSNLET